MRKSEYNFVAIGAGSAGLVATYLGAALKAKVALIERHKMGGDCLNTGCVPSKALLRTAKALSLRGKAAELGLRSVKIEFDFAEVMDRVQRLIRVIEPHDSVERYTGLGIACYQGEARVLSAREVQVGEKILRTNAVVVASGAKPFIPDLPGLKSVNPLTSDTIWSLRVLPKRLLVLGGGAIGCELAQAFQRLGSEVTLVERNPHLLPRETEEVGAILKSRFEAEGMRVLTGTQAMSFQPGVAALDNQSSVIFDQVLVALGRKANVSGFGLEELGVQLRSDGTIEADSYLRTSVPGIFACGDVTGPYQFTHFAALTGTSAALNALFRPFRLRADWSVFPFAMYTDPEVARVGLSEIEAKKAGLEFEITNYDLKHLDRAVVESENFGFVKVLTRKGSDSILGATIMGANAGEMIQEFTMAMKYGLGLKKILAVTHAYPTYMEANKFAAGNWAKAHSPAWALRALARFHELRRNF